MLPFICLAMKSTGTNGILLKGASAGVKGSMSSMYSLMRHPQKHIEMGIRCSLENFGTFESPDGKKIDIIPLYAISNLFQSPHII